jgi:hypothetical protein
MIRSSKRGVGVIVAPVLAFVVGLVPTVADRLRQGPCRLSEWSGVTTTRCNGLEIRSSHWTKAFAIRRLSARRTSWVPWKVATAIGGLYQACLML